MEYVFMNLLTADDMRRILKQRELRIPNIDEMSYEELHRIYSSFAVPMDRREHRQTKRDMHNQTHELISKLKRSMPPPVNECASKLSRVTLNVNVTDASIPKRKQEAAGYELVSKSTSKRVKITWP